MAEASKTYALTIINAGVQQYVGKVESQDENQIIFVYKKPRSSTMLRGIFAASQFVSLTYRKGEQVLSVVESEAEVAHYKEAKFLGWKNGFAIFEVEEGRVQVAKGKFKAVADAGKAAPKSAAAPAKKKVADKAPAKKVADKAPAKKVAGKSARA